MIKQLPAQAEQRFGPPTPGLSSYQRYSLAARLLSNEEQLMTGNDLQGAPRPFEIRLGESTYEITNRLQR